MEDLIKRVGMLEMRPSSAASSQDVSMGSPAKARRLSMSVRSASAEPARQADVGGGGNPSRLWNEREYRILSQVRLSGFKSGIAKTDR
eukprot:8706022-Lingulodinium_polyedra.AAC.1